MEVTSPEKKKREIDKWAVRRALRQDARDAMLFLGGMAGIVHETIFAASPRESLLILFGAMIGIIPFLRLDEALSKARRSDEPRDRKNGNPKADGDDESS